MRGGNSSLHPASVGDGDRKEKGLIRLNVSNEPRGTFVRLRGRILTGMASMSNAEMRVTRGSMSFQGSDAPLAPQVNLIPMLRAAVTCSSVCAQAVEAANTQARQIETATNGRATIV
jgi:hypothetical protein